MLLTRDVIRASSSTWVTETTRSTLFPSPPINTKVPPPRATPSGSAGTRHPGPRHSVQKGQDRGEEISPPQDLNIQHSRDELKFNQEQLAAVLNLLMLCCKIREHRRALLRLGALNVLLETARHAFSVDAMEPAYFDCGEPEAISSCCYQILEIISSCCLAKRFF